MKALRSPWVSGALAVIAVVVVVVQFVPLQRLRSAKVAAPAPPPPAPAAPANPPALAEPPAAAPAELALVPIERAVAESRFAQWAESPARDPFWLLRPAVAAPVHRYPSPVLAWKLNAIWRQTDGRVAAIDNHIYAEGDRLQGYRILKIDADRVLFEGPDGAEVLTFAPAAVSKAAKKK